MEWTQKREQAFESLKETLVGAPTLTLPNVTKPLCRYVHERKAIAKGVLTQTLGR